MTGAGHGLRTTFARHVLAVLSLTLTAAAFSAANAQTQARVALVIGNSAYQGVPALPNPVNDASDVSASLTRLGFSVRRVSNGNFDDMRLALRDFARTASGSELAVVYFAGHGIEIGGENWLLPVDAQLQTDTAVHHEAVALRSIFPIVAGASKLGLVILDACRNNPFSNRMQRSIPTRAVERGFARVEPTGSVLVAYAARDGTTASDGSGRNSPFTSALLADLEKPGLEVGFLFRTVRERVLKATDQKQEPVVYGSLPSEAIYFKRPDAGAGPIATAPAAGGPSIALAKPEAADKPAPDVRPPDGSPARAPWFGAQLQPVTPDIAAALGLKTSAGALVSDVAPNSPADRAGLKSGDVIAAIDGQTVDSPTTFVRRFSARSLGGSVPIEAVRAGKTLRLAVALEPKSQMLRDDIVLTARSPFQGAKVVTISPAVAAELRLGALTEGVAVVDITDGGTAASIGFQKGDIILMVNGQTITRASDLDKATKSSPKDWRIKLMRGGQELNVTFRG